jgi:tetratricopeptide (TPR) repeat protein
MAVPAGSDGWEYIMRRRAFLAGGLAASALPAVNLDNLHRLVAALDDARRYLDKDVVAFLRQMLASAAAEDGDRGPKATLPVVLGIVAAVDQNVRQVKRPVRRELLAVGARSAEFAGWLYRDIGVPDTADYWRDRAMEWAQAAGDGPMQGYILLKKSQSAWDQRNATRMLTLAEAVQDGPWELSPRVSAEAAQQAARGYAMLAADWEQVARKLDEARTLFAQDPAPTDPGVHYAAPLFELQTAICYQAAGQPQQALAIYDEQLTPETFSRRDYGFFLSLKSEALASAGAPDDAAESGLQALALAAATDSVRTRGELDRLVAMLRPDADRPKVRELRQALLVG